MKKILCKYPLQFSLGITLLSVFIFELFGTFGISSITNNSSEYNVIAMAADLAGYDWKSTILKTYYYGYTASFLFSIVFGIKPIVSNPNLLLHFLLLINILINIACTCILFFLVINIIKINSWKTNYPLVILLTTASSLLISNQVLSKNVTNENVFLLCYYIAIYIIVFGNKNTSIKNQICNSVLLALINVISYATNGRGIILIVITLLMFIIFKLAKMHPFGNMGVFLISFMFIFIISQIIKGHFVATYYFSSSNNLTALKNSDVKGIVERAFQLLNFKGLGLYFNLIIGWGTYFIVSTYGVGIVSIVYAVRCIKNKINSKQEIQDADFALATIILSFIIGISVLGICFYYDSFYAMSYDNSNALADGRVDKLIYGRYISTIKSIVFAYGLLNLIYENEKAVHFISFFSFSIFGSLFYIKIVPLMLGKRYAAVDIPEFALFFNNFEENYKFGRINDIYSFKLIFSTTLLIYTILYFLNENKKNYLLLIIILLLNMSIGIAYTQKLSIPRAAYYKNLIEQNDIDYISNNYVDKNLIVVNKDAYLYQFFLPTSKVITLENLDSEPLDLYDTVIFLKFKEKELMKLPQTIQNNCNVVIMSNIELKVKNLPLKEKYKDIYVYQTTNH